MKSGRQQGKGFTLIDLMIACAVVGILAAIAFPSYMNSVRKGHRGAAQSYLTDLAQRQQQYFTDNRAFATAVDTTGLNDPVPATVTPYYRLTLPIASGTIAAPTQTNPPAYTITLTAIGSQVADGNLQIDSTGAKTPATW